MAQKLYHICGQLLGSVDSAKNLTRIILSKVSCDTPKPTKIQAEYVNNVVQFNKLIVDMLD